MVSWVAQLGGGGQEVKPRLRLMRCPLPSLLAPTLPAPPHARAGFQGWRVEVSKKSFGARAPAGGAPGRGMGGGGRDMACYNCGGSGVELRLELKAQRAVRRCSVARVRAWPAPPVVGLG